MAKPSFQPYNGPYVVNVQHLSDDIVDVEAGGTKNMKREGEGYSDVHKEINAASPELLQEIGISPDLVNRINTKTDKIAQIRVARRDSEKVTEVLGETEAKVEDDREADVGVLVNAVRQAARRKDKALLVPFEKTIRYHGQVAARAAKTRKQNAKAKKEQEASASQEPAPAASPEAPALKATPT